MKQWVNFIEAQKYVKNINKKRVGGFNDWRLPKKKELKTLYNKKEWFLSYDNGSKIYTNSIFKITFCYFWTNEKVDNDMTWQVSLCDGKAYQTKTTNNPGNLALLIRP